MVGCFMAKNATFLSLFWFAIGICTTAQGRLWTDSSDRYTLDAELVTFNDRSVVLQRADHELVAIPLESLSQADREYLASQEARDLSRHSLEGLQTWKLADGSAISGRVVDFAHRTLTLQRRRSRIYVNDRPLENLPEFYQQLVPMIVAHFENLRSSDRQSLERWLVRQRGAARTFQVEGVVLETENGDEYGVPFFLLSKTDRQLLQADWDEWLAAREDYETRAHHAFLLQSLAAARHRDALVQREIAQMQLQLQAVQAGLTSLWEVTLYPAAGQGGPPLWVVMPGRDSRQATAAALSANPGYMAGPVRRVAG
jgi:hypothetical protein